MNYRSEIKSYAKKKLTEHYLPTLGACLLVFLPDILFIFAGIFIATAIVIASYYFTPDVTKILTGIDSLLSSFAELVTYLLWPFSIVGLSAFMLSAVRGVHEKFYFPYVNGAKNYGRKLGGLFLQDLFIFLWALLFIIPGIIKSLSYSFNQYILADCPNLTARDALNLSKKMTSGIKGEIFVFELSFIGWWLLTALTCGILGVYTVPYYMMAKATLYESIKNSCIVSGKLCERDFDPTLVYVNENNSEN